jgi:hypothetical protein
MTTPSSTSQSSLLAPGGRSTGSFGPFRQVVHLLNTIGAVGIGIRASFAWSR